MYYFYLLKCKDNSLYSGITNDIVKREQMHNSGKGSKYVRAHGGGKIVYSEKYKTISGALKREAGVKKLSRAEKLELIKSSNLSRLSATLPKHGQGKNRKTMEFQSTNKSFDNEYPKLVRDRISEIVLKKTGKNVRQKILKKDAEYLKYLFKKVIEEAKELEYSQKNGNTKEEIADILEILEIIVKVKGLKWEEIKNLQTEKRKSNGGFEKRIILLKK